MAHDCDASPDPDGCFKCRCRYWRAGHGLNIGFQGGRDFFHDKTIKTEQEKIVAQGKAHGNEMVPFRSVFGNS